MIHIKKVNEMFNKAEHSKRTTNESLDLVAGDTVIIKSYFSDDYDNSDGLFKVTIPQKYSRNYKNVISEVGNVRNDLASDMIETVDDIVITPSSVLKKEDYIEMWEKLEEYREEGGSLSNILNVLGWVWEPVEFLLFDADYNVFK